MRSFPGKLLLAALLVGSAAVAQPRDPAAAEVLFSEGRDAIEQGDYETACDKFAESQRLDPASGTLINLAACHEKLGRLASAWHTWRQALRWLDASDDRRPGVAGRIAALEKRLPRLEISLAADPPPGTTVRRDELELGRASLGSALPVDPGKHEVIVSAPGYEDARYVARVREGETKGLVVQVGKPLPETKPEPKPDTKPQPSPDASVDQGSLTKGPLLGWVILGAGAASLGVGVVTGILAIDRRGTFLDECDEIEGTYYCSDAGLDAASSGSSLATVSTITVALGVAAGAVGTYLVLTADDDGPKVGAIAHPWGGSVSLEGRF